MMGTLNKLLDNCRKEMGPKLFREFRNELAGKSPDHVPVTRHVCAICEGDGINPFDETKSCEGCNGHGEF